MATPDKKTPARRPARSAPAPAPAEASKPTCNVTPCAKTPNPDRRGLCDLHWATHRHLANPKEAPHG